MPDLPATARVSTRLVNQMQFDEGADDDDVGQDLQPDLKTTDLRTSFRKNIFKGKRLNIFGLKAVTKEAPDTQRQHLHFGLWNLLSS